MVPRLSLLDDVLSLLVGALVHTLHHVFDLLQLQPLQVLVLVQGVRQHPLYTVTDNNRGRVRNVSFYCENKWSFFNVAKVSFLLFLDVLFCLFFFP